MITYEEAKKIALKYKSDVDQCEEFEDAYIFSNKKKERGTAFGFSHIVILKENGNAISMASYNIMPKTRNLGWHEF